MFLSATGHLSSGLSWTFSMNIYETSAVVYTQPLGALRNWAQQQVTQVVVHWTVGEFCTTEEYG